MTGTFRQRLVRGARWIHERPEWQEVVGADWPDRIMDVEVTDHFHSKQGRSTGRWIVQGGGRKLVVYLKRHYRLARWRGLLATLWPTGRWSPALQEWDHLAWARREGLPVPQGLAAAQYVGPWGKLQSFLAVEELHGMLPLHQAIPLASSRLSAGQFQRWKRSLAVELARLSRALHDRRCFHKDLYLCHFYIAAADTAQVPRWTGRVYLIDLHRFARHRWTWRYWQVKDLAELLYSAQLPEIDDRDRLAFWRAYQDGDTHRSGWLKWLILGKWRVYRRHNEKKKRRAA